MKRLAAISLLVVIGLIVVTAQVSKTPFTIADLYRIQSVADPQISPDGRRVAFTVTTSDLVKGTTNADVHVINLDGTSLRRLTASDKSDSTPRWSPDGKTLLFVSTRSDGAQLWLLPADGGEPRQLTRLSTGAADPVWTPDGQSVIFTSEIFPECGADDACNKRIQDGLDKGPLKARLADDLMHRHWASDRYGKHQHTLKVDVATGAVTDLTPGGFDTPTLTPGVNRGYAFSPDGLELCVVSKRDPDEATSTNNDLWLYPMANGALRCITAKNPAFDGDPLYSPDGRYIAYRFQTQPGFEADRFRLAVYDRRTDEARVLTDAFDNWVDDFCWTPDSAALLFTAQVRGRYPVYRVPAAGGPIIEVMPGTEAKGLRFLRLTPDGNTLVFIRSSVGEPAEMYAWNLGDRKLRALTAFNRGVAEAVDIRPAEEIEVPGAAGHPLQIFIVKPHGFDPAKKYPLILNVHGGPQMMWADSFRGDWQVYPGAGYVVAFPNPHGSTGFGQAYTDAISRDWGGKVIDDVMMAADALAKLPYVDADRMGVRGWSWGGYAVMWLEGHTDRFQAAVARMGVYDLRSMHGATEELWFPEWDMGGTPWESDLYEKFSPSNHVAKFKTPCLVITGERDYRVPYTQSLHFFTDLQRMQVPSRLIVFENDGHWPNAVKSMPFYYNAHLDWFHKYLGGAPAPYDMIKMWRNQAYEPADEGR